MAVAGMRRPSARVTSMRLCIMHDVAVGENQAIGSEDETRASAAPFARLARASAPAD